MTTPDNGTPQDIIIDLSESLSATCFKKGEGERLLQRPAREQVEKIVKDLLDKAMDPAQSSSSITDGDYPRSHDVITINGERGSGKTTFILNILELVSSGERFKKDGQARIRSLGIIDPTLLEDCAHIFLAVISKIKEAVDRHWEETRIGWNAETVDGRYQQWRESLTRLAGGLRHLGKKKDMDGDNWADPQFIMEEGLENAAQGVKLERHFHCFVEDSLRFIEKDAFIIALDDVDTKAETGWPVLEVLRKYLTSPRLIVILSGDIELYTQLIFSQQCKQTGVEPEKIIEKTKESERQIALEEYITQRRLVDDLTEQYMMKILRPDYRIEMQTVAQIAKQLERDGGTIVVRRNAAGGQGKKIGKLLEGFCEEIYGSSFQKEYLALVLTEVPTRTCIQLLNAATRFNENKQEEIGFEQAHLGAVASLGHVFQNALALAGLPSKLVNEVEAQNYMTLGRVAVALHKKDLLAQGFYLFPDQALAWQRQLMMVLSAVYTRLQTKQPGFPFSYLVSMCLPASLQRMLAKKDFEKYLKASRLETEQEAINAVRRALQFLLAESNKSPENYEPLQSVSLDNGDRLRLRPRLYAITIDACPTPTSWHRYLLNMISVFVLEAPRAGHYLSFLTLLGAIATLAFSVKKPKKEDAPTAKEIEDGKRSFLRICRQYGGEQHLLFKGEPGEGAGQHNGSDEEDISAFYDLFAEWCYTLPKKPQSLLVITESWSRFEAVGPLLAKEDFNPEGYLQRCILYYLSILLEYEMSMVGLEPGSGNHADDAEKFAGLLDGYFAQKKTKNGKLCPLFEYFFACPIWMHFLQLDGAQDSSHAKIMCLYTECLQKIYSKPRGKEKPVELEKFTSFSAGGKTYSNLFRLVGRSRVSQNMGSNK